MAAVQLLRRAASAPFTVGGPVAAGMSAGLLRLPTARCFASQAAAESENTYSGHAGPASDASSSSRMSSNLVMDEATQKFLARQEALAKGMCSACSLHS